MPSPPTSRPGRPSIWSGWPWTRHSLTGWSWYAAGQSTGSANGWDNRCAGNSCGEDRLVSPVGGHPTDMQPERFRPLLTSHGPFGSVYFEDSHDTEDANAQIELKWRALREQLEQQGADSALTESIGRAIADAPPGVGRSGRAVVAGADGVLVNEHLIRPTGPT